MHLQKTRATIVPKIWRTPYNVCTKELYNKLIKNVPDFCFM